MALPKPSFDLVRHLPPVLAKRFLSLYHPDLCNGEGRTTGSYASQGSAGRTEGEPARKGQDTGGRRHHPESMEETAQC